MEILTTVKAKRTRMLEERLMVVLPVGELLEVRVLPDGELLEERLPVGGRPP